MKKTRYILTGAAMVLALSMAQTVNAQIGKPYIHDPSTIAECEGKYYTFGTGGGGLISADGWTWDSGAERPGGGAAPDVLKIGDRYLVIYGPLSGDIRCHRWWSGWRPQRPHPHDVEQDPRPEVARFQIHHRH